MEAAMEKVTRQEVVEMLLKHRFEKSGRIFTVTFIKRGNGERRVMNARFGVTKHLKGGELKYNPKEHRLIGCFDVTPGKGYRMIATESILELKLDGKTYVVEEAA